jgi:hypothetical protein
MRVYHGGGARSHACSDRVGTRGEDDRNAGTEHNPGGIGFRYRPSTSALGRSAVVSPLGEYINAYFRHEVSF